MLETLAILTLVLLIAVLAASGVLLLRRPPPPDLGPLHARLETLDKTLERGERALREEFGRNREETAAQVRALREDFGRLTEASQAAGKQLREEVGAGLKNVGDSLVKQMGEMAQLQKGQLEAFAGRLEALNQNVSLRLETLNKTTVEQLNAVRETVGNRLREMQEDNTRKLEAMRQTVDEKLQETLEKRLGESFTLVSERLEQVHKGLGEMQQLASGVGDLKRVLTNVKTRGTWGEVQLGNLLEQVLTPQQYARNVATRPGSNERVEFAIRLPGRDGTDDSVVWLPIDAKFPVADYQRLVDAAERGDDDAVEAAGRQIEQHLRGCARDIHDKYVDPPHTTDFALLFLPIEGLYAEALRRPGLAEALQREFRVVLTGPTTLSALLNSLQMGFRTLAIERRSSEVWKILSAVKTEFAKFGQVIDKVKKKLQEASNAVDDAQKRSRAVDRRLRSVEVLPDGESERLRELPPAPPDDSD